MLVRHHSSVDVQAALDRIVETFGHFDFAFATRKLVVIVRSER